MSEQVDLLIVGGGIDRAPPIAKPLRFPLPIEKDPLRPVRMVRLGLLLYDLLAGSRRLGRTHRLESTNHKDEQTCTKTAFNS